MRSGCQLETKWNIKMLIETIKCIAITETVTCINTKETITCIMHCRKYSTGTPTCIITRKIVTLIFAAETGTYISAAEDCYRKIH